MGNQYEKMSLAELKAIAKERGIQGITAKKKQEIADILMQKDEAEKAEAPVKSWTATRTTPVEKKEPRMRTESPEPSVRKERQEAPLRSEYQEAPVNRGREIGRAHV